ncbi:MAG: hypothetical protein ACWA47_10340 [Brevirhabdus sp.]
MPKRLRQTRRVNMALTEDAYRALRRVAAEGAITEDEALIFLLENWSSVIDQDNYTHRLRLFVAELADRRK